MVSGVQGGIRVRTSDRPVNFFWHGPRMGRVHAACLRSFLRHGHRVVLHGYAPPEDLPEGVEVFDAERLMPKSDLLFDKETGSVATGADRYRYRILKADLGDYADCDMYLLRPLPEDDYLIGRQNSWGREHPCNSALLRYPADSRLAEAMVETTRDATATRPWQSRKRHMFNAMLRLVGRAPSVTDGFWGEWGPRLLSHWVEELGLKDKTKPIDVFYPLHYFSTDLLFEPGLRLADLVTPRTVAVHLCHNMLGKRDPVPGSPLDEILRA